MNAAHEFQSAPQDFLDLERLPERRSVRWLIPGVLPEGFSLIVGRPKAGKTTLMAQMALELTRGGSLWGRPAARRRVAIIAPERPDQIEDLIRAIRERDGWGSGVIEFRRPGRFPWPLNRHIDWWRDLLERLGPGGVVFIDPLADALDIEDENDRAQVARALNPLWNEAAARGISVVAVHHLNKVLRGERGVLGSTRFAAAADAILFLYPQPKRQEATLKGIGSRMPEFAVRLHRIPIEEGVAIWDAPEARKAPAAPAVPALGQNGQKVQEDVSHLTAREQGALEVLRAAGKATAREIANQLGIQPRVARRILARLMERGLAKILEERGRHSRPGGTPEKVYAPSGPSGPMDLPECAPMQECSGEPHPSGQADTSGHSGHIYSQCPLGRPLEDTRVSADTRQSADGVSISNANITLKDIEPRRNENESSVESARISINFDHQRTDHDANSNESCAKDSDFSSESSNRREFNSIFVVNLNEDSRDLDDWDDEEFARDPLDSLIDYLLDYSRGMSEILPQFFKFLDRRDGILEQGRKLAKNRPDVCRQVPRARALMRRMVREWEDNRLEMEELAADLGLIAREEADRAWHPEIMKAILAAGFLQDPARIDRAARFLEEPSESSSAAREIEQDPRAESSNFDSESNESSSDSANPHSNSADMSSILMDSARESKESATRGAIPEAPIVRVIYVRGETGICGRFLAARCPYCGGIHEHGGGSGSEPVEEFLGVTRAHCVPSGPEYRLALHGNPEIVHEPLRKATEEASSGPSGPQRPSAKQEVLMRRILEALTPGPKTDVELAEQLQVPRPDIQEALRILAARGQVAAFASDGVCCWARVPPGSPTEARESSESDASNDGYREVFVWADISTRYRDVFRAVLEKRAPRPSEVRPARVPTSDRLLNQYFTLISRRTARMSSISSDSSDEYPEY